MQQITQLSELEALIATGQPVVIDFYAVWCGPCRAMAPQFEALSKALTNVNFVKVDVDAAPEISAKMQITAMPTFITFKNGVRVSTIVGADPRKLEAEIKTLAA